MHPLVHPAPNSSPPAASAVEEANVSGAGEFAPALAAYCPFGHFFAVARLPHARRLDESCPPSEFTAKEEEKEAMSMASSSSAPGEAPMPEAPTDDPAAAPILEAAAKKKKRKRVIMTQSHLDALIAAEEWELSPPLDEEWLKAMTALIPNGERFSLEKCDNMDFAAKAQTDMITELRKQQREKGYIEMEVTDSEDDGVGRRWRYGRGRKRFRPGVWKKPGGEIKRINLRR
ncbi:hypothetical protein QYE76_008358 [Lolium multiflorum]|uniref:Uncharacterized protein n=1 Tax=Lolium multiflorum TaxID=4521 RepID=A0AAD8PHP8_LOLMU|nr:hypothetical protein QYE76_017337 [Lolium multiflorum]KAK1558068.1 hypothetical protein QYE76_008358 [Lolium multiflorum]